MFILLDTTRSILTPEVVDRLASLWNLKQAQVRTLFDYILPAEADAMIKRTDTPAKVRDLLALYNEQRPATNLADLVASGDAARTLAANGEPLVSRILGNESDDYRECIARMTDVPEDEVWTLMKIGAMLLVGAFNRVVVADKLSNEEALKLLQDQKASVAAALPKGLLECVAIESKADEKRAAATVVAPVAAAPVAAAAVKAPEPVKVAEPVRTPPPPPPPPPPKPSIWRWLLPLLGLLALGALLWFLLRPKPAAEVAAPTATAAPAAAVEATKPPEPTMAPEATEPPAPTEAPAAATKPALTFWHTMNEQETPVLMEAVNKAAEEAGVDVKVEYVPFDGAQQKFLAAAQGGNAPDVFRSEIAWTPQFADAGYLLDITDQVSAADKADYLAAPLAYNMFNGKEWGVPQVTDAPALLYNKELVKAAGLDPENPPKTMDEFVAWCKALTKADGSQYGFNLTGGAYFFQPFMWAFGGGLIDEDDLEIHIADQGTVDAANFVLKLRDVEQCMPKEFDPQNQYNNAMTAFKTGQAAMIFNGPWATADVLSGDQFKDPANFGIAPIPAGPGGQGSPVGGHNYVIYAGTAQPDAAVKFLTALNSTDNQGLLAEKLNLVPTRKSAYELPAVKANAILQGFGKQMAVATNRPVIPQGGQIYTDFDPAWVAVLSGSMTPEAAFQQVAAAWEKLLQQ